MTDDRPFWRTKTLAEMSPSEWESLCDGCGRCCLVKLEEDLSEAPANGDDSKAERIAEANPDIYFTDVGCKLLDAQTCRCRDYPNRSALVADCLQLTPEVVAEIGWLPPSCGYRLVLEGRDLYWWHPLVSGDPETVHLAGVSVRGRVGCSEEEIAVADLEDHIVTWPLRLPQRARRRQKG